MKYFILALGLVALTTQQTKKIENMPNLSYCELVEKANEYNGKTVRVTGIYSFGFEGSELYCTNCRDKGRTWVDFDEQLCSKSHKIKGNVYVGKIIKVTFIGNFQTNGYFGHLNGYTHQILVTCVESAKTLSNSNSVSAAEKIIEKTQCK